MLEELEAVGDVEAAVELLFALVVDRHAKTTNRSWVEVDILVYILL